LNRFDDDFEDSLNFSSPPNITNEPFSSPVFKPTLRQRQKDDSINADISLLEYPSPNDPLLDQTMIHPEDALSEFDNLLGDASFLLARGVVDAEVIPQSPLQKLMEGIRICKKGSAFARKMGGEKAGNKGRLGGGDMGGNGGGDKGGGKKGDEDRTGEDDDDKDDEEEDEEEEEEEEDEEEDEENEEEEEEGGGIAYSVGTGDMEQV
jgi:hypothetical protein